MKSLEDLPKVLLAEAGRTAGIDTSLDLKLIESRFAAEGLSFLTMTLPSFTKSLYEALDRGRIVSADFPSFGKSAHLPHFMRGFMERIFDSSSGELLDGPDLYCIRATIQVTGSLGKVEIPCSPERVDKAFLSFVENDVDVRVWDKVVLKQPNLLQEFRQTANALFGGVFHFVQRNLDSGLVPAHGPGATAERLSSNRRWKQCSWPSRLEEVFPMWKHAFTSARFYLDALDDGDITEPGTELPVRVVDVPKTLKAPRIIAIEPACMQYVQQGLRRLFEMGIESDKLVRSLITLRDQTPNQRLALLGSLGYALPITGTHSADSVATLDLSDASDRVSNLLVKTMLLDYPELNRAVQACRSTHASVPGFEGVIPLAKFASMGSALTFVMETIVFTVIVTMAIRRDLHRELGPTTPLLEKRFSSALEWVHVFGDDIVVPKHHAAATANLLEDLGLKVNDHKSFAGHHFRESCGKEYFKGFDVTHVKLRQPLPERSQPATEFAKSIMAIVSFRNLLMKNGWYDTCDILDTFIEGFIPFPTVAETSPVLGRHDPFGRYDTERMDLLLQRPMVKGAVVKEQKRRDPISSVAALNKFFFSRELSESPIYDPEHLLQAGRPVALRLRLRFGHSY